jgi:hypothetical protein
MGKESRDSEENSYDEREHIWKGSERLDGGDDDEDRISTTCHFIPELRLLDFDFQRMRMQNWSATPYDLHRRAPNDKYLEFKGDHEGVSRFLDRRATHQQVRSGL